MKQRQPKRISFSELREFFKGDLYSDKHMSFYTKGIGVFYQGNIFEYDIIKNDTPYIIEDCRLGVVTRGSAEVSINMTDRNITKGMAVFIGTGSILQVKSGTPDFELCDMMVSNERVNMALNNNIPPALGSNAACLLLNIDDEEMDFLHSLVRSIWELVHKKSYSDDVLNGLIHAVIHYYNYLNNKNESRNENGKTHTGDMFDRFIKLLNAHSCTEHSISFYADKMCVTPRYLGSVVKEASGVTAKEWIDRAIITSAKIMLKHTDKQIVEITDLLNFTTPSFFCKYFKRITGMTPQEYRRN